MALLSHCRYKIPVNLLLSRFQNHSRRVEAQKTREKMQTLVLTLAVRRYQVEPWRKCCPAFARRQPASKRFASSLNFNPLHEYESSFWQVLVAFRRFLGTQAQQELQQCALNLYSQAGKVNPDVVWLVLKSTTVETDPLLQFMKQSHYNIDQNADIVLQALG